MGKENLAFCFNCLRTIKFKTALLDCPFCGCRVMTRNRKYAEKLDKRYNKKIIPKKGSQLALF